MHPENKMAAAIGGCMLSLVLAGVVASFAAAWFVAGRVNATFWLIGLGAGPVVGIAVLVAVFPDMGRMWLSKIFPPTFHFELPAGFKGRFYVVAQESGPEVPRSGGAFRFAIPAGRVLRVRRFPGIDNAFARATAVREGAPAEVVPDGRGMSSSPETGRLDFLCYYAGSREEQLRDDPGVVDLAEQVRRAESGGR
jgi:hypothetical protein